MLTNTGVTVFRKEQQGRDTVYTKHYIPEAHWEDTEGINILKTGLTNVDRSTIYIPLAALQGSTLANSQTYINPGDIIVKGIIDDAYTTIAALEKKYAHVRTVTKVDRHDYALIHALNHLEVGAV